jgi:hypothetical protein
MQAEVDVYVNDMENAAGRQGTMDAVDVRWSIR